VTQERRQLCHSRLWKNVGHCNGEEEEEDGKVKWLSSDVDVGAGGSRLRQARKKGGKRSLARNQKGFLRAPAPTQADGCHDMAAAAAGGGNVGYTDWTLGWATSPSPLINERLKRTSYLKCFRPVFVTMEPPCTIK